MRARTAILGGAICAVLAGSGSAEASGTASGPSEFAFGSATNRFAEFGGPNSLAVWAHRRSATQVTGYARGSGDLLPNLPGGDFKVEGPVTCLRVEPQPDGTGTTASIKYRFKSSTGSTAPPQGGGVEVFIEDNGPPEDRHPVDGNGTGPPLTPEAFEASDPKACDDPNIAGQPYNPVDSGDYRLHDAPN
jgi:hypothetical protein